MSAGGDGSGAPSRSRSSHSTSSREKTVAPSSGARQGRSLGLGRCGWRLSTRRRGQDEKRNERQHEHTTGVAMPLHQGTGTSSTATKFPSLHSNTPMCGSPCCSDTIICNSDGSFNSARVGCGRCRGAARMGVIGAEDGAAGSPRMPNRGEVIGGVDQESGWARGEIACRDTIRRSDRSIRGAGRSIRSGPRVWHGR